MREHELTLDEMLDDPIVRLLMTRDGVHEDELRDLAAEMRGRRRLSSGEGDSLVPSEGRAFDLNGLLAISRSANAEPGFPCEARNEPRFPAAARHPSSLSHGLKPQPSELHVLNSAVATSPKPQPYRNRRHLPRGLYGDFQPVRLADV